MLDQNVCLDLPFVILPKIYWAACFGFCFAQAFMNIKSCFLSIYQLKINEQKILQR